MAKISTGSLLPFSNENPGDGVTMTAREMVRESRSRVTDLIENQTNADIFQF